MKINNSTLLSKFLSCTGVSTDTRKIQQGNLFFALKGPNFNANQLAEEAIQKGAQFVVIDDVNFDIFPETLLVEDSLQALQDLARDYRNTLHIPIIGLTGSNGKTTTKELIFSVLSQKFHCYATVGNLNNHIGGPLSILAIRPEHEIAVIEMGANKQGDIQELVHIAQPTHGLITNIGKAHLEGFGGIEGVKKGKGELFEYLAKHNSTVFIPKNQNAIREIFEKYSFANIVEVNEGIPTVLVNAKPTVVYQTANGEKICSHLPGIYNFENIQMALAVGNHFGLSDAQCHEGIASYAPTNHRSQFLKIGSNQVLMDAYNANPSSMTAAIQHFNETDHHPKIVILGDMFELGESSQEEHKAIGQLLSTCQLDKILLVGTHFQHALVHLPNAYYFPDKFGLHNWLQDNPIKNSYILVKGSRGIQLESILAFLE
jgi:UDP-N-acetylmuramoyl-tripeptide--D-alanyl-D-alanine ligase